jgi:quercetin dioxygenase-like cupin family protein
MKIENKKWIKGVGGFKKKILVSGIKQRIDLIQYNKFPRGCYVGPHQHTKTTEIFYVISGRGILRVGKKKYQLRPGVVVFNPAGQVHELVSCPKELHMMTFKIKVKGNKTVWFDKK